jgi:hypothetical protein
VNYFYGAEAADLSSKRVAQLGSSALSKIVPRDPQSGTMLVFEVDDHKSMGVVDTRTGKRRSLRHPMSGQPQSWAFDEAGELRALTMLNSAFWDDRTMCRSGTAGWAAANGRCWMNGPSPRRRPGRPWPRAPTRTSWWWPRGTSATLRPCSASTP